jgi:ATP-binding cassette subfamily G (WHITE) protein 2 (SNQ2)
MNFYSALLFGALTSMSEIPSRFSQRPIVLRHQKSALYHPFIEAVALTLVDIPITFITMLIFATVMYEIVQLQQSANQFL